MRPRPTLVATAVVLAALTATSLAGCSSSSSDGAATTTTAAGRTTTTVAAAKPVTILVSNDDGYQAEGIDTLVEALRKVDGVKVVVVAPLGQQSGTGGKTTPGVLKVTDVKLKSGYAAKAVDGYPADTIRAAVDQLGVKADLAITGINEGQNLGPAVNFSGTVGAARAAVADGIPALATSQGSGTPLDYASAVPFILKWVTAERAALAGGTAKVEVDNLNVPTCATGSVRGLVDVPADLGGPLAPALAAGNCASTAAKTSLTTDVQAFLNGFATFDVVPSKG